MHQYQRFDTEITPGQLLEIMGSYDLKAGDIIEEYTFDAKTFEQQFNHRFHQHKETPSRTSGHLEKAIMQWPKKLSWPQFNIYINHLLSGWIKDYRSALSLDHALILARCIRLEHSQRQPHTSKDMSESIHTESLSHRFQLLLAHLLARITNQYELYRYEYLCHFDPETSLPRRSLMLATLEQQFLTDPDKHVGLILLNFNIDFGKKSLPETIPTELALAAIVSINRILNERATLFQLKEGEFAIIVNGLSSHSQLDLITTQLIYVFDQELPLEHIKIIVKPYLGAASTFHIAKNPDTLIHAAQQALQHAITHKRQSELYHPQTTFSTNDERLEEAVIKALQEGELELFLQPIITLSHNDHKKDACRGAELLLRWQSQDWPAVSPVRLIDIIYSKGFGKAFIRWLVNSASRMAAELSTKFSDKLSLTINLSAADLVDNDLPALINQAIQLWDVPADNLVVEMTEGDLLIDEQKAMYIIEKIVALGCRLALDDFGTGYSSMSRLRNMPIDIIKIDQSFVRNIDRSNEDKFIVQSILQLAHNLGKEVIAEGVEDITTVNFLKDNQCGKIQGYYYARPLPFADFCQWLTTFEAT